jgi:serine/threonine protein kinase/WD40 repeat protein
MKTSDQQPTGTPPPSPAAEPPTQDGRLVAALKEYEAALHAGHRPDRQALLARYPEIAASLAEMLDGLDFVAAAAAPLQAAAAPVPDGGPDPGVPERLGDFRLLRQAGQGGMGLVFEALQESLGRRVALKVLPPTAALTALQRERFRREARAAAGLHHSHIVPVFGVGEHQGVLYYAMQFIDGLGLDQVILHLRRRRSDSSKTEDRGSKIEDRGSRIEEGQTDPTLDPPAPILDLEGAERFRGVARLGMQAAEALQYAHERGVLHRDVKPSNLLLDGNGSVWVADFGLAKLAGTDELTHPGAVVGTLRYLAPERFHAPADVRSDVYSLGATLYELLTLQPAFGESDRHRLVERITQGTPARPRRLDHAIPRDLETVVLKALEREPGRRYQTAGELAEDLRRFLADRPIRARPLGPVGRLAKWGRRRPGMALLLGLLLAALLGLAGLGVWSDVSIRQALGQKQQEADRANAEANRANGEANRANGEADRALTALAAAERATYRARFNEAVQRRLAQRSGWRRPAWDSLRDLAGMDTPERDVVALRTEAVACLEGLDLAEAWRRPGHKQPPRSLDFSPDGQTLASAGNDGFRLWNVPTGQLVWSLDGPGFTFSGSVAAGNAFPCVRFHPGGGYLLYTTPSGAVAVRGLGGAAPPFAPLQHRWPARALAFDLQGRTLAVTRFESFASGHICLHDAADGRLLRELRTDGDASLPVALSPDGEWLAVRGKDGSVALQPLRGEGPAVPLGRAAETVRALSFSPDGALLAAASAREVRVWDVRRRRERFVLQGHSNSGVGVTFSPDGQLLATAAADAVLLWEVHSGLQVFRLGTDRFWTVEAVAFSPDGAHLARGDGGDVVLSAVHGRRERQTLLGLNGETLHLDAHPRRPVVVSADLHGAVQFWDLAAGRLLREGPAAERLGMRWAAFHPSGDLLALGRDRSSVSDRNFAVVLCDAATGQERQCLVGPRRLMNRLVFHPAGRLAVGADGDDLLLWDLDAGRILRTWPAGEPVVPFAFVAGGAQVASVASRRRVQVRDADSGRVLREAAFPEDVRNQTVSPDGRLLTLVSGNATLHTLTLPDLEEVAVLPRSHGGLTTALCYSPDGRLLVSGGFDGRLIVRDARTLQTVFSFQREPSRIPGAVFSADGQYLLVGTADRRLTLHHLGLIRSQLADIGLDWDHLQK